MGRFKVPHVQEPSLRVKALRYFMTIFCAFFLVFGFSVITCGSILAGQRPINCTFTATYYTGVYFLLAGGCATSFVSIATCVSIHRTSASRDFIPLGAVAVVVIVLQLMAAVAGHVAYTAADKGNLASEMQLAWENNHGSDRSCINNLQEELNCCGIYNHSEWMALSSAMNPPLTYPVSCLCGDDSSSCVAVNVTSDNTTYIISVHNSSCYGSLLDHLYNILIVVRIVGPSVSALEVVFLLAVIYFLRHIDNHSLVGAYIVQSPTGNQSTTRAEHCSANETNVLEARQWSVSGFHSRQQGSLAFSCGDTVSHL